jgi:glyoxylase I family protein
VVDDRFFPRPVQCGGLGSIAAGPLPDEAIRGLIRAVRGATPRPFHVNLANPLGSLGRKMHDLEVTVVDHICVTVTHAHYFNRDTQYTIRPARTADRAHDSYSPGLHHICFRVSSTSDVDTAARELRDLGVVASQPNDYPEYSPDYYATFFSDPDAIRLEVAAHRRLRTLLRDHWDSLTEFESPLSKAGLL